jgi:hypothetical protein
MKLPEGAPSDSEHFKIDESRQVASASVAIMAAATAESSVHVREIAV